MRRSTYKGGQRILLCLAIFALLGACFHDDGSSTNDTGGASKALAWDQGNWDESNWQ